jgi:hypothetical protein
MKAGIGCSIIFSMVCLPGIAFAQNATDFLPPSAGVVWTYHTIEAIDDSVVAEFTYFDTLSSIGQENGTTVYTIRSSNTMEYAIYANGGNLAYDLTEIIGTDFFGIDVDLDSRVDIARFTVEAGGMWEIYQSEQTITLTDSLLELVPDDITIDDEATIILTITGERRLNQNITVPAGTYDTYIFDTLIDLDMIVYATVPIFGLIPVPLTILDAYRIRTYYAEGIGPVSRVTDTYDVYMSNETFGINEYIFTIAGSITTMTGFTDPATGVPGLPVSHPGTFVLRQNYPNPFNPSTTISFTIPVAGEVSLTIYNVYGQEVARPVEGSVMTAGTHTVRFDGDTLPSGVYFCRVASGMRSETIRMVLIR